MKYRKIRAIISGGGTGGHIFPALSIANKLKELNPETEILFVGADGRMEMERVPAAGYKIVGLPVAGLQRKLTLSNLALPFKVIKSIRMAKKVIREFKPDIAIGVGGYASAPLLWAAGRSGIPTLIQEQNGFAGLTNKIVGRKVKIRLRGNRSCLFTVKYFECVGVYLRHYLDILFVVNYRCKRRSIIGVFRISYGDLFLAHKVYVFVCEVIILRGLGNAHSVYIRVSALLGIVERKIIIVLIH